MSGPPDRSEVRPVPAPAELSAAHPATSVAEPIAARPADSVAVPADSRRLGALHSPLRDKVAEQIRAAILSGHFKPGDRLIEDRLAEEFAVSRNPIREAMRTLASEGLIEVTARRGAVVASLSPQEAEELLEVRATLEGANARLAA